jgi:hypothetical protein
MKKIRPVFFAILLFTAPLIPSCKNKDKTTTQEQKTDAPVTISSDDQLRSGANTVVAAYTGVSAEVNDGVITVRGTIKREDLQTLISKLQELKPRKVENQLVIQ